MEKTKLLPVRLNLFDDGAPAAESQGESAPGRQTPQLRGKKAGEFDGASFGRQETAEATEGYDADSGNSAKTPVDRQKEFERIINEEYKDLYTQKMQSIINRRFKESKQMEEQLSKQGEILALLNARYGTDDIEKLKSALENDRRSYEKRADEIGWSGDQVKEYDRLLREIELNRARGGEAERVQAAEKQYAAWLEEASELSEIYPDFDLRAALQNPRFRSLLATNNPQYAIDMKTAYEVSHIDHITKSAAAAAVKAATENIRARGARPPENGTAAASGVIVRNDVSSLTRAERAEIVRRALGGDTIRF